MINKVNAEMRRAVANAEFVKQIEAIGLEVASSTPQEMHELMKSELARWTKVIKANNIKPPEG